MRLGWPRVMGEMLILYDGSARVFERIARS